MSVTISILDNVRYCERKNLVVEDARECCCVFEGISDTECPCCRGSGEWVEKTYPFELSLSVVNFSTLWHALGLARSGGCIFLGTVDGRVVAQALRALDLNLAVRAPEIHDEEKLRVLDFGMCSEQVERYVKILAEIAAEAERREANVCWGY